MTVLDDFATSRRRVWPTRALAVLLLGAVPAAIVALVLSHSSTRIVTRTVSIPAPAAPATTPPSSAPAGAVLAAKRFMGQVNAGQAGSWTIGYRLLASTPSAATIETLAASTTTGPAGRTTDWWVWQLPLVRHRNGSWSLGSQPYGEITPTPRPELYTRWSTEP